MKRNVLLTAIGLAVLAMPAAVQAQGVVRGQIKALLSATVRPILLVGPSVARLAVSQAA